MKTIDSDVCHLVEKYRSRIPAPYKHMPWYGLMMAAAYGMIDEDDVEPLANACLDLADEAIDALRQAASAMGVQFCDCATMKWDGLNFVPNWRHRIHEEWKIRDIPRFLEDEFLRAGAIADEWLAGKYLVRNGAN